MKRKVFWMTVLLLTMGGVVSSFAFAYAAEQSAEENQIIKEEADIEEQKTAETELIIDEVNLSDVLVLQDIDVIDYPARKEGQVVGELLEDDEVDVTGSVDGIWSRICFVDRNRNELIGYVPSSVLKLGEDSEDGTTKVGELHEGTGSGVFSDAIEGVEKAKRRQYIPGVTVEEGEPIGVAPGSNLLSMGEFRITHYCACPICCGPWVNGMNASGNICTSNRTIAVNPTQIPYGTRVVINGQIYVAEDCGGAIKDNCIDIYVPTHEEALARGLFYTEVFVLLE